MKQTELSKISGVPISTLAEWKRTKPKLRALLELGAESYINAEAAYNKTKPFMSDVANIDFDMLIKNYHDAYIAHYSEYTSNTARNLLDAQSAFLVYSDDNPHYDEVYSFIMDLKNLYDGKSGLSKKTMEENEQKVMKRLQILVAYLKNTKG